MIILEDTRQQTGKHDAKHDYFEKHGIEIRRTKLYVGDYTLPTNQSVCVDTKKDIQELVSDLITDHKRFREELIKAQESGIQLFILVENKGGLIRPTKDVYNKTIRNLDELHSWKNPRLFIRKGGKQLYPKATKGIQLQKMCYTMQQKYGVRFMFCAPEESGQRIIELLTNDVIEATNNDWCEFKWKDNDNAKR